jgi:MinD-like ATPase involved in chromosome partitioning or flagellar assembly
LYELYFLQYGEYCLSSSLTNCIRCEQTFKYPDVVATHMGHSLAITSVGGGNGVTTACILLSSAFAQFGHKNIVVDCHFKKPDVGFYLGQQKPSATLATVQTKEQVNEIIYSHTSGVHAIFANHTQQQLSVPIRDIIAQLVQTYALLLVDTPQFTQPEAKQILESTSAHMIVIEPTFANLAQLQRHEQFLHSQKKLIGIVLNKSKKQKNHVSASLIQSKTGIPVIGEIPYDTYIIDAQCIHLPVHTVQPLSPGAIAYKKLAANLGGFTYESTNPYSFLQYLLKRVLD